MLDWFLKDKKKISLCFLFFFLLFLQDREVMRVFGLFLFMLPLMDRTRRLVDYLQNSRTLASSPGGYVEKARNDHTRLLLSALELHTCTFICTYYKYIQIIRPAERATYTLVRIGKFSDEGKKFTHQG